MNRLALFLFSLALLIGCDTFEGPEGPEGPPGAANIEAIERSYTADDASISESVAVVEFNVSAITQEVYEDGAVDVEYDIDGQWIGLPWTIASGDDSVEMNYSYEASTLNLIFISNSDSIFRSEIPEGTIKVTVIPPSEAESNASTSAHKVENAAETLSGGTK
jgi:hypothetical protein